MTIQTSSLASRTFTEGAQALQQLVAEIWVSDRYRAQLGVSIGCAALSIYLGYTYADSIPVAGWQLSAWLGAVILTAYILLPLSSAPAIRWTRLGWLTLGGVIIVALLLRGMRLDQFGLHVDEAGVADFALRHVWSRPGETINPFITGPASQPTLHHYLIKLSLDLFGHTITGLRLPSVLAGTLGVAATWAVVAVVSNRRTAFLAAIIMAAYHYHIHWSRIALSNVWDTLWVPGMLAACVWGWKHRWSGGAIMSGLAVGFSQYFYAGNKVGVLLIALWLALAWRADENWDWRWFWVFAGKLVLITVVVAAPIALFAWLKPDVYFLRPKEVYGWTPESMRAAIGSTDKVAYLWYQVRRAVGAFIDTPDITGFYGPGVPLTIGLATPLLLFGFMWAIRQKLYLPVLWLVLTLFFGGIMLNGNPSSSHLVVAIPAVCWLIALLPSALWERGQWWISLLLLAAVVGYDLYFYFGQYILHPHPDLHFPFPTVT
jgi:4-amino-4-deoxy-L-arabinose transferase-like glycosyltransferase